jgi:hypothetical protein
VRLAGTASAASAEDGILYRYKMTMRGGNKSRWSGDHDGAFREVLMALCVCSLLKRAQPSMRAGPRCGDGAWQ